MSPALSVRGRPRIAPDGRSLGPECLEATIGDGDLAALDAAIRLREDGRASRVICIAPGGSAADALLAHGIAMGADRAVRIASDEHVYVDACALGSAIAAAVAKLGGGLVFAASRSADGEAEALPHMIAVALGAACLTNVVALRLSGDGVEVERRLEAGQRETWGARLPAVVAFDPDSARPVYVTVAALALARRGLSPDIIADGPCRASAARRPTTALLALAPARIRPKRLLRTPAQQSEALRMRQALAGGAGGTGSGAFLSGAPEHVAGGIVAFLRERGLLSKQRVRARSG